MKKLTYLCTLLFQFFILVSCNCQIQKGQDIIGDYPLQELGAYLELSNDGERLIIGNNDSIGTVKVYQFNGIIWQQIGNTFYSEQIQDRVSDVSISGDGSVIAIGIPRAGIEDKGQVKVFKLQGSNWEQYGNFINSSTESFYFGQAIDLSNNGSRIVVGTEANNEVALNSGQVTAYEIQDSSWVQLGQNLNGSQELDWFGWRVNISENGNRIVSHARQGGGSGYIRAYEFNGITWNLLGQEINQSNQYNRLGYSLTFSNSGDKLAFDHDLNIGDEKISILKLENGSWVLENVITFDISSPFFKIREVELSKGFETVAVSIDKTPFDSTNEIVIYKLLNNLWNKVDTIILTESTTFGNVISLSEEGVEIALGAMGFSSLDPSFPGLVRVYEYDNSVNIFENNKSKRIDLRITPNPLINKARLNIDFTKIQKISIFNLNGVEMKNIKFNESEEIDFSHLNSGVYYLIIIYDGKLLSSKFIKLN